MRIAVISDIHGNKEALDAVLDDIAKQNVDQTICAGDFIDPLPDSKVVWDQLKALKIPTIRGNHEDYVIQAVEDPNSIYSLLENWAPVRTTARLFSREEIAELKSRPIKIELPEVNALICHASPGANYKGWLREIDDETVADLTKQKADFILCGHWHNMREENWNGKRLVMIGSVGVPLHKKPFAEYTIIEKRDEWNVENRFVPYDHLGAAKKYVDSGFVAESMPVSLLLLDEFLTQDRRISPFIAFKNSTPELAKLSWSEGVELFYKKIGRWEEIKKAAKL